MQNKSWTLIVVVALVLGFGWWLVRDTRVEITWEPDWPESLRVSGEATETVDPGTDGKVSQGELSKARERALWKAYYFAQLRAAERLRELEISAETVIHDLEDLDQELRASIATTLQAAHEVDREVEELDDAVRAKVTVEIPAASLTSLQEQVLTLVRAGRIEIERRPRETARAETPAAPEPAGPSESGESESGSSSGGSTTSGGSSSADESVADAGTTPPPAAVRPAARPAPPPRQSKTGAVIVLAGGQLNASPTLFDKAGTEIGTSFDLPADRMAAGFRFVTSAADDEVNPYVGNQPRRFEASVSMGDIFLNDKLDRQQAEAFRSWLRAGRVVLVAGDVAP